ncbi:MAG: hypothetical protein A3D65_06025 [Candidatus Lloydbacteria bacterium RIFCSPHIGHO2_02_FULL_50_13]|uniref:Uncharacterized protein n=1 Tax=Candidatus Lloydbacteria bacterium RIFCSPHIGHO2_02_FULL_50_13 TaxID=1798661 RepID=A0A1G2D1X8_9BACT|nr:MAG: hypothetical protein A3D65_06025 [Candidatus Lloydbacteria bacterium RIFCSPHIGHO2_02_FULL_50_13]
MGTVTELCPHVKRREHLADLFVKKMTADRRLSHIDTGATRERVEKTVSALCLFIAFRDRTGGSDGLLGALKILVTLLEREALFRPLYDVKAIALRALEMLEEGGFFADANKAAVGGEERGQVVNFSSKRSTTAITEKNTVA